MWTEEKLKDHLRSRGMIPELYNAAYDAEKGCVTFPLFNGMRVQTGYQRYNPDKISKKFNDEEEGRYHTYLPSGVDGVFGLECLDASKPNLYIVEGIFKASKLHSIGENAIAVLTNHPKRLKSWFRILKTVFNLVAIGDNDVAGQKLVSFVGSGFSSPKDLDEMTNEEVIELLGRARTP